MIDLPHRACFGCQACSNICPKNAIVMEEDEYGYMYPKVINDLCIKCGLCIKVCPALQENIFQNPKKIYALKWKDKETVKASASGGFATVLSRFILLSDGVIYGCCEENFETIGHIRIEKLEELWKLKNSKYVHSNIRLTYREAREDLRKGKKVLFTGTPCQIAGLKKFLMRPYENLITMDLVCHGVPPMKMLKEQVQSYHEVQYLNHKDIYVDFRWKKNVRTRCAERIQFGLRTSVRTGDSFRIIKEENDMINPYMRAFQTGISLRENCLFCPFAKKDRVSDFTAADFWGLGSDIPSFMIAREGVSLVLINTTVGEDIFKEISCEFQIQESNFYEASMLNKCLTAPFKSISELPERDKFLEFYRKFGLNHAIKAVDKIHCRESLFYMKLLRKVIALLREYTLTRTMVNTITKVIKKR